MGVFRVVLAIASLTWVAACSGAAPSTPGSESPDGGSSPVDTPAATYCVEQGGMVVHRVATWNTNGDPSAWLPLANALDLCEFEMGEGDGTTRISVDLATLYATVPSLAAVAYLSKVPTPRPPQPGINPGAYDCTTGLGGATDFGNTAAGGGWVAADEPVFTVMNLCVFADMSAIDEFGLFYYANGTIRGADLATKLRYRPDGRLPAMFTSQ